MKLKKQLNKRKDKIERWINEQKCRGGLFIPGLHAVNETNAREHWTIKAARAKQHRQWIVAVAKSERFTFSLPATVRMTRYGPKKLDSDNLQSSLKHVRDGLQDLIGVDDGDPRWDWQYRQDIGPDYAVRIEVVERKAAS